MDLPVFNPFTPKNGTDSCNVHNIAPYLIIIRSDPERKSALTYYVVTPFYDMGLRMKLHSQIEKFNQLISNIVFKDMYIYCECILETLRVSTNK